MPDPATQTQLQVEQEWPRLDHFLAAHLDGFSRTRIQRLIKAGHVAVDGRRALKAREGLNGGEQVSVDLPLTAPATHLVPEPMNLDIIHEDDHLILVHKPAGLVVHPGSGIATGTLANGLMAHFADLPQSAGPLRPGIVHRLDKDTSGIMVVAKTETVHTHLARQFEAREVAKIYQALVWGAPPAEDEIDLPLARDPRNRVAFAVSAQGRSARTHYRVTTQFEYFALVEIEPKTGRTHQIRVHLAHVGHPVFGDALYHGAKEPQQISPGVRLLTIKLKRVIKRQALHASQISFTHPADEARVTYTAPLPSDFAAALDRLQEDADALQD